MEEDYLKYLVEKYRKDECNATEKKIVEDFFKKCQKSSHTPFLTDQRGKQIFKHIKQRIPNYKRKKQKKYAIKIAATAAILVGAVFGLQFFLPSQTVTQISAKGEKKEILLQDGSVVILNANSSITYPKEFGNQRNVDLTGQAFFKVKKDTLHPFVVNSKELEVTVLGTSFDVNTNHYNSPKVSVISGKVKVASHRHPEKSIVITKNEQVTLKDKSLFYSTGNSNNQIAWTKNVIVLEQNTLKQTAAILENWYDIKIDFEEKDLEKLTISGKYKDEKLKNVLKSIALLKNLKIDTLTQNHLLIRRNN